MNKQLLSWSLTALMCFVSPMATALSVGSGAGVSAAVEAMCTSTRQRLAEISGQLDNNQNCDNLIKKLEDFNALFFDFGDVALALQTLHVNFDSDFEREVLADYRVLEKASDALVEEARAKDLLLTPDKRKGKPLVSVFSANSFAKDEDEATLIDLRARQKEIFLDMVAFTSSASDYSKRSEAFVDASNAKRLDLLAQLATLSRSLIQARSDLEEDLMQDRFPQCVGVMPDEPFKRLQKAEGLLKEFAAAGVKIFEKPRLEIFDRQFTELKAPAKPSLPDGSRFMLVSSEVDMLVIEQLEAAVTGAEQTVFIELLTIIESVAKAQIAINSAIETGMLAAGRAIRGSGAASDEYLAAAGAYIVKNGVVVAATDATLETGLGILKLGKFLLVSAGEALIGGITSAVNLAVHEWIPDEDVADVLAFNLEQLEKPLRTSFDLSKRSGRASYMQSLRDYRIPLRQHAEGVVLFRKNVGFLLAESGKVALAGLEVYGIKTGIIAAQIGRQLGTAAATEAVGFSAKAVVVTQQVVGSTTGTVTGTIKLSAEALKTLANASLKTKKIVDAAVKVTNKSVATTTKEVLQQGQKLVTYVAVEGFVEGGKLAAIKSIKLAGTVIEDLRFGKFTSKSGNSKTLVTTNKKDVFGLFINADAKQLEAAKGVLAKRNPAFSIDEASSVLKLDDEGLKLFRESNVSTTVIDGANPTFDQMELLVILRESKITDEDALKFFRDEIQRRESAAVRIFAEAPLINGKRLDEFVQISPSTYSANNAIKVVKAVPEEDMLDSIARKNILEGRPAVSAVDEALMQQGLDAMNARSIIALDTHMGNVAVKVDKATGERILLWIDEDSIILLDPLPPSLKNRVDLDGNAIKDGFLDISRGGVDLSTPGGIKKLQTRIAKNDPPLTGRDHLQMVVAIQNSPFTAVSFGGSATAKVNELALGLVNAELVTVRAMTKQLSLQRTALVIAESKLRNARKALGANKGSAALQKSFREAQENAARLKAEVSATTEARLAADTRFLKLKKCVKNPEACRETPNPDARPTKIEGSAKNVDNVKDVADTKKALEAQKALDSQNASDNLFDVDGRPSLQDTDEFNEMDAFFKNLKASKES